MKSLRAPQALPQQVLMSKWKALTVAGVGETTRVIKYTALISSNLKPGCGYNTYVITMTVVQNMPMWLGR